MYRYIYKNITIILFILFVILKEVKAQKIEFPYQLKKNKELIISSFGVSLLSSSFYFGSKKLIADKSYIESLDKSNINSFDFGAINNYNNKYHNISNIATASLALSALGISAFASRKNKNNFFTLVSIYSETMLINAAINNIFKSLINRPRPFLYNNNIAIKTRIEKAQKGKDGLKSFYSGHTSIAFSNAIFLSKIFSDLYPKSKFRYPILLGSLTLATYVGYSRYKAGKHFPTDIITGAIMGSFIAFIVPQIHKKKNLKP